MALLLDQLAVDSWPLEGLVENCSGQWRSCRTNLEEYCLCPGNLGSRLRKGTLDQLDSLQCNRWDASQLEYSLKQKLLELEAKV